MERRRILKRLEKGDGNSYLETKKKPNGHRKLQTYLAHKILERMINKRLVYVLTKSRSTTDVLVILQNNIAEAFRKKNQPPWFPWIYPKPMT
jgi:hypothetical protein